MFFKLANSISGPPGHARPFAPVLGQRGGGSPDSAPHSFVHLFHRQASPPTVAPCPGLAAGAMRTNV